jgi:ABC-type nitrate/sulfonate/bicarbonate transport system ATPase subunit
MASMKTKVSDKTAFESLGSQGKLAVLGVSKTFHLEGRPFPVLQNVSLSVRGGEFVTIIGPSGCGKSTLFNIIAGLEEPSAGDIVMDGNPTRDRMGRVGYMFQKDLLLPWRRVLDNAILGLELEGKSKKQGREDALPLLEEFGLRGFEKAYPHQLSGGMRQRVAFLRTVLTRRDPLLLDEPFGALDALTRSTMQEWLLQVWGKLKSTVLYVTHDVEEAVFLSDRVYVMTARPGRVKLELPVRLPRPRFSSLTATTEFLEHKRVLLESLKEEATEEVEVVPKALTPSVPLSHLRRERGRKKFGGVPQTPVREGQPPLNTPENEFRNEL